jgi:hypothetical protein
VHDDVGAHLVERLREAQPVLVHGLVHGRDASACVRATMSGCCQSVMKPGCTSVSTTTGFSAAAAEADAVLAMSKSPPALRNTLRKVSISCCFAPPTKMSPSVASAAHAHDAASLRSKIARWS